MSDPWKLSLLAVASAMASFALGWPVWRLLVARNIIDKPNERSSHTRPTARGGGIAIMAVVVGGSLALAPASSGWLFLIAPCVAVGVAMVSFIDDMRSVSAKWRFGCHAAGSIALLLALGPGEFRLALAPGGAISVWPPILFGVFFLWLAGHTNAFNFMDGINGLAGFQAGITGLGMVLLAGLSSGEWFSPAQQFTALLAAAAIGFLPHNFPKARMFMGDVGSAPIGLLLAFSLLWLCKEHGWELLIPLALLHANFVLDTGVTLARRVLRGEEWHSPHREHFYQRLIRSGRSHAFVTLSEASLLAGCLGALALAQLGGAAAKLVAYGGVLAAWGLFFLRCERVFVRSGK